MNGRSHSTDTGYESRHVWFDKARPHYRCGDTGMPKIEFEIYFCVANFIFEIVGLL